MVTTRLQAYNGALDLLGQEPLASLTEAGKPKRALDRVWDESVSYVLAQGLWNFATRSSEIDVDEDVEPLFGYRHAFRRPVDFVRTIHLSDHSIRGPELRDYQQEADHWFAHADRLYLRYVSKDDDYGLDLSRWPETFALAHQAYLAFKSGLPITGDKQNRADLFGLHERLISKSKVLDAVEQKVGQQPLGRWAGARFGGHRGRYR